MSKKFILIILFIVAVLGICGYAYLGGFHEVKISRASVSSYKILGKHFEGKVQSKVLEKMFFEAKEYVENHPESNSIAILYYKGSDNSIGLIDCFVGPLISTGIESVPAGFEVKEIIVQGAVSARFEGHRLVTPQPDVIYEKIKKYAEKNNITLQNIYIEKYFSDNAIEIDYLIQD